jgi:mRNA interferase RelE/StbE
MVWTVELSRTAEKALDKLDSQIARRILVLLKHRVAVLEDPPSIGEPLRGAALGTYWKYHVGDYRLICDIEDGALKILVVRLGNRREVYR